jgi:hypothetical protein
VLALLDRLRNAGWAIRHDSSMWLGNVLLERTRRNSLGLYWGLKDAARKISFGFDLYGGHWLGRLYNRPLGANSLDLWHGWGDPAGQVSLGLRNDGTVLLTTRDSNVWVEDGNIWALEGGYLRQVTDQGGVLVVENVGNGWVRFTANWTGLPLQYTLDKAAPTTTLQRLLIDAQIWAMIQGTGQSLMQAAANAAETTVPLNSGVAWKMGTANVIGSNAQILGTSLQPLAEYQYESISSAAAESLIRRGWRKTQMLITSGQAWGGMEIEETGPGGHTGVWDKMIAQVAAAHAATGGKLIVRAQRRIQGEADGLTGDLDYDDDEELQRAQYEAEVSVITGQREPVYLFTCQTSSVSGYRDSFEARQTFRTPFLQARAARLHPLIKLVCPKYMLTYKDHSHIDALSVRLLGEHYGRVEHRVLMQGLDWRPTQVDALSVDNDTIVLDYHAPTGALVLDDVTISDPGNYGYQMHLAGGVDIAAVTQTGDRQITLTCTGNVPSGALLSYAHYNGTYGTSGRLTGARGCVRDSDPEISRWNGQPMRNWAISFEETLTI